ncbi:DUF2194 domain-containing protein [Flavobacterium columnare]|uniref:DUF2194 domain-containing protein n=1 Tax=Flavobacterium columnare TaxID=996 RepID=A0AA94JR69_9FLAO|nr:DUF2194 domain-containing protein [Flavobacterium columnare]MCH4829192.1 DUF2194 domain-containing protein [Flavobacterium columnare]MCH4833969.1 DUF2194 domain-containing protein [Flavobacterium columnare]
MKLLINRFQVKFPIWFFKILMFCLSFSIFFSCNSLDSLYRLKNDYLRNKQQHDLLSPYESSSLSKKPVVEYILDSKDDLSVTYYEHFRKICDYTKIPFNFKIVDRFNEQLKIESSARILIINDTKRLNNQTIPVLLKFVSTGGTLIFPNIGEDQRFLFFWGMRYDSDLSYDITSKGICLNTISLGGKRQVNLYTDTKHFAFAKVNFRKDLNIGIWSDNQMTMPILIENNIGMGKVICCNSSKMFEKRDRGLLFTFLLRGLSGIPYPLANTSTVFLDDFPSPLYDSKQEPIRSEYNLTMNEFVYKKWWPDMKKIAQKYNIKYTALLAFDYDDIRHAPFSFKQWDFAKMEGKDNTKRGTSNFLTHDLLKENHELGFHGYNHVSLLKEEWKDPEDIFFSLKATKKKWLVNDFGDFPVTYVPPSNYIDPYGISELKRGMSSLKYFSSLYLGDKKEGGDREFDFDPYHKDLFDYPRVSSGFYFNDEKYYNIYSTYLYTGVWTHFVHPDDVFQIGNKKEKKKKKYHYELRNDLGLNWKRGKKTLYSCFDDFLTEFKEINPQSEFYTVKDAAPIVMKWRESKYEHLIIGEKYIVREETDLFTEKGNTWGVYFDELTPKNKEELATQSKNYSITDFMGGKLVSLKSANKLSFTLEKKIMDETQIFNKVLEEYNQFGKNRELFLSGKLGAEDYFKKLEEEKRRLLALMLSQPKINYVVWNKYATYMSWDGKGDEVWKLLEKHCDKYPSKHNINYSFELSNILGYSSEELHTKWICNQYQWNNEKLSVLKEYLSIITASEDYDEIKKVLFKIFQLEPNCENQEAYLYHALVYAKDEAFKYLETLDPATSYFNENLVSDISWSYVNENEDYQNAINWSEYTSLISADTRLSWMFELRQYVELEQYYRKYISQNPNDESMKQKMFQIYEILGKYDDACGVLLQIKDQKIFEEIKEHLNEQILYFDIETQEELIRKYPTIFTPINKEKIVMKLKDLYGDYLDANSTLSYFVNKKTNFQNHIKYAHFDKQRNSHDFYVKHKELYSVDQTSNNLATILELAYEFKRKQTDQINKFFYTYGLGLEKDWNGKLYYNAKGGINLITSKYNLSTNLEYIPANFLEAYKENIYQFQWNGTYNRYLKFLEVDSYFITDYYPSLSNLNFTLSSKIKTASNREKNFKINPYLEVLCQFSNIDEKVKVSPVYLIKSRYFGGAGVEANLGDDYSKFKLHTSGAYYFDSFENNFINFRVNSHYKVMKKSYLKVSADINFQSKYNFNTFGLGYKYIF